MRGMLNLGDGWDGADYRDCIVLEAFSDYITSFHISSPGRSWGVRVASVRGAGAQGCWSSVELVSGEEVRLEQGLLRNVRDTPLIQRPRNGEPDWGASQA